MITVEVANEQDRVSVDQQRLAEGIRRVLSSEGIRRAQISLAVVDDPTIHELNRRFLEHDWPTDVITFLLDDEGGRLEGEIVVSADTAHQQAESFGWNTADELLLYCIHGALHLVGFDDQDPESLAEMRAAEQKYLNEFGLQPRYDSSQAATSETASDSIRGTTHT